MQGSRLIQCFTCHCYPSVFLVWIVSLLVTVSASSIVAILSYGRALPLDLFVSIVAILSYGRALPLDLFVCRLDHGFCCCLHFGNSASQHHAAWAGRAAVFCCMMDNLSANLLPR